MVYQPPTDEKALHTHGNCVQGGCNRASVGGYAQPTIDLSPDAWSKAEEEHKKAGKLWKETVEGRGAIRLFSRGVMGATAFAIGSWMARTYGGGYNPNLGGTRYTWSRIAEAAGKEEALHRTVGKFAVHGIARLYDDVFGTTIKGVATALGKDAQEWVTFRPTRVYNSYKNANGISITGRSLGQEVVGVTLDFATMSIGDALGRDIADWLDPNAKHDIYDDKGHIDPLKAMKAAGKAMWRYVSYNAGEDWAVAVPYVYFMKGQRGLLNKVDPGFAYDSDRSLNGASFKLDDHGRICGNYALTGAVDLQTRFTVYNVFTLMFREAYSEIANRYNYFKQTGDFADFFHGHKDGNVPIDFSKHPLDATLASIDKGITWAARSAIKGTLYMTPAVPFFWMSRTPQMKYRGTFIHPEHGLVLYKNHKGGVECLHANEPRRTQYVSHPLSDHPEMFYSNRNAYHAEFNPEKHMTRIDFNPLYDPVHNPPDLNGHVNPRNFDSYSKTYGAFDTMVQPFGKLSNAVRKAGHKPVRILSDIEDRIMPHASGRPAWERGKWKTFSDHMTNASLAYTPYFFMKSDVAGYYWDTGKMDFAIEGLIDGLKSFSYDKTARGVGEMWNAMWYKPLKDPAREIQAQKARCDDISASDGVNFKVTRKECLDNAVKDICKHEEYQEDPVAKQYIDKLQAEREQAKAEEKVEDKQKPSSGFAAKYTRKDGFTTPAKQDSTWSAKSHNTAPAQFTTAV
jgi:hypothetical protein